MEILKMNYYFQYVKSFTNKVLAPFFLVLIDRVQLARSLCPLLLFNCHITTQLLNIYLNKYVFNIIIPSIVRNYFFLISKNREKHLPTMSKFERNFQAQ